MRYNDNREVNEMQHRENGEREKVDSTMLMTFLGDDNYQNKAEEMLLDILNDQYNAYDALNDIMNHWEQETSRQ